jgi:hypothetical protein
MPAGIKLFFQPDTRRAQQRTNSITAIIAIFFYFVKRNEIEQGEIEQWGRERKGEEWPGGKSLNAAQPNGGCL